MGIFNTKQPSDFKYLYCVNANGDDHDYILTNYDDPRVTFALESKWLHWKSKDIMEKGKASPFYSENFELGLTIRIIWRISGREAYNYGWRLDLDSNLISPKPVLAKVVGGVEKKQIIRPPNSSPEYARYGEGLEELYPKQSVHVEEDKKRQERHIYFEQEK